MKECFCTGPQGGQPLCPCRMRRVVVEDGRYVEKIDYGPVVETETAHVETWKNFFLDHPSTLR